MPDLTAKRTLVKSPPELWEELSEVEGLAKHLGAFGEIKITKLEPEHTVAWEGEHASGTVSIEPSGWGTKVTLHAELPEEEAPEAEPAAAAPEPVAEEPVAAEAKPVEEEPVAVEEPVAEQPAAVTVESDALTVEPEPSAVEVPPERKRRGFWGWLFRTRTGGHAVEEPEPVAIEPEAEPEVEEPEPVAIEPKPEPVAIEPEPEPVAVTVAVEPDPEQVAVEPEVEPESEPEAEAESAAVESEPQPEAVHPERARAILDEALDALGAAHHRPFSRG